MAERWTDEDERIILKLIEVGGVVGELKAENKRLKDENAFLRKLLTKGENDD